VRVRGRVCVCGCARVRLFPLESRKPLSEIILLYEYETWSHSCTRRVIHTVSVCVCVCVLPLAIIIIIIIVVVVISVGSIKTNKTGGACSVYW
jgi:hypothetical protein